MKTLILVRHAKAVFAEGNASDHERPLHLRGHKDAPKMAEQLATRGILPDLMISSSAVRALETTRLLVQGLSYQGAIDVTRRLYLSEPAQYLEVLSDVAEDKKCVALVGHNPTCSELLHTLTGENHEVPTCGTAVISLPLLRWAEINLSARGHLAHYFRPKEK